jgi:hypothetical protein
VGNKLQAKSKVLIKVALVLSLTLSLINLFPSNVGHYVDPSMMSGGSLKVKNLDSSSSETTKKEVGYLDSVSFLDESKVEVKGWIDYEIGQTLLVESLVPGLESSAIWYDRADLNGTRVGFSLLIRSNSAPYPETYPSAICVFLESETQEVSPILDSKGSNCISLGDEN